MSMIISSRDKGEVEDNNEILVYIIINYRQITTK